MTLSEKLTQVSKTPRLEKAHAVLDTLSTQEKNDAMMQLGEMVEEKMISKSRYANAVEHLLNNGAPAEPVFEPHPTPALPLLMACKIEDTKLVRLLLEKGAKPDREVVFNDEDLPQPLHVAASLGNVEIATLLLEMGANTEALNGDNIPPIEFALAAAANAADMIKLLVQHGARLNYPERTGASVLHAAAWWTDVEGEIFSLLLELGADPSIQDNKGTTVREILEKGLGGLVVPEKIAALDAWEASRQAHELDRSTHPAVSAPRTTRM